MSRHCVKCRVLVTCNEFLGVWVFRWCTGVVSYLGMRLTGMVVCRLVPLRSAAILKVGVPRWHCSGTAGRWKELQANGLAAGRLPVDAG